jgi:hypothetical protein
MAADAEEGLPDGLGATEPALALVQWGFRKLGAKPD